MRRTPSIVVRYQKERFPIRQTQSAQFDEPQVAVAVQDSTETTPANWLIAAQAADSKQARDLKLLDLRDVTSFTDYFLICTGMNKRQSQAISDEIYHKCKHRGELPVTVEGYDNGEWILMDYSDFLVHIFSETARSYYDLERLWRHGKSVEIPDGALSPA